MATEPALAVLEASAVQDRRLARSTAWFDYWELTKPEINFLICHHGSGRVLDGLTGRAPAFSVDAVPSYALGHNARR